jgi:lambda family phage portal protein
MRLNPVERALATVFPRWGVERISHKLALGQALEAVRGFDAARRDRRTEGWQATAGSANAELQSALGTVIRRSRDTVRNNEWGANAKRKLVAHIIGAGLVPRAATDLPKSTKRKAKDLWQAFGENCDPEGLTDIYGIQARAMGEVIEGGACFIRWYMRNPELGLKVPLQCEVLEHEHLDVGRTEIRDGRAIVNGVEYDGYGRRVAYWLYPDHPGNASVISLKRGSLVSQRVPAAEVDHVFRVDRVGQVTGVPWLAPVMLRLRDVADYEEAELLRKKIEACLTVFVTRADGGNSKLVDASQQKTSDEGHRLEQIRPGLIAHLRPGDDIKTAVPTPAEGYADHMRQQWLAAAAGLGLTYSSFSGDLSNANFSSMREGKIDFWATLDQWQWHMAIPQLAQKMWRRCMLAAFQRGHAISGDIRGEFAVPARPWVDPMKDIQAKREELALGLTSWSDEVAARGYDPQERLEQLAQEHKELAAAGLSFGQAPAAAPEPKGDAQDDEDPEPAKKPAADKT